MRGLLSVLVLLALTGCGGSGAGRGVEDAQRRAGSATSASPEAPAALLGTWRVTRAAGEEPDVTVAFNDAGEVVLTRACGESHGGYLASPERLFVAYLFSSSEPCGEQLSANSTPRWLAGGSYREAGPARVVLDRDGDVLARLARVGDAPEPVHSDGSPRPPSSPLPPGLVAAGASELRGRWVETDGNRRTRGEEPFVEFLAEGRWRDSDGCNRGGGSYVVGDGGLLLGTSGFRRAVGCDNRDLGQWVVGASRAGLSGTRLVLLDAAGTELGRLERG